MISRKLDSIIASIKDEIKRVKAKYTSCPSHHEVDAIRDLREGIRDIFKESGIKQHKVVDKPVPRS